MVAGGVRSGSLRLLRPGPPLLNKVPLPMPICGCPLGGREGLVGEARGDRELVRGGGGGGTRRPASWERSSELRSGTGGLGDVAGDFGASAVLPETCSRDRAKVGGEFPPPSELEGYECRRLSDEVPVDDGRVCAESMLPLRPMSAMGGLWPREGGRANVCNSSSRASSAFSGRCLEIVPSLPMEGAMTPRAGMAPGCKMHTEHVSVQFGEMCSALMLHAMTALTEI